MRFKLLLKVFIVFIIGAGLTAGVAFFTQYTERRVIATELRAEVREWVADIDYSVNRQLSLFQTVRSVLSAGEFSGDTFYRIAEDAFSQYSDLYSLSWVPVVEKKLNRAVRYHRPNTLPAMEIQDWSAEGVLVPAGQRDEYFPIEFLFSRMLNYQVHGLDLSTVPGYASFLQELRLLGEGGYLLKYRPSIAATLNIDASEERYLQIAAPIFWETVDNEERRQNSLRGFLILESQFLPVIEQFIFEKDRKALLIEVKADNSVVDGGVVYRHESVSRHGLDAASINAEIPVGNSDWMVLVRPTNAFFTARHSRLIFWVVILGVLVTCFVASHFYRLRWRLALAESRSEQLEDDVSSMHDRLQKTGRVDELTGLPNRSRFDEELEREWRRCLRKQQSMALLMIDIDEFHAFNQVQGNELGDQCLRGIASILIDQLDRASDSVSRYGGEEFAILLPDTDASALEVAEACRKTIASYPFLAGSDALPQLTVSIGVAVAKATPEGDHRILVRLADEALYKAKSEGGNRSIVCQQ